MRDVRRIAVFRARRLGDMLAAVPALRSLRAGFPRAEITLIGLPWAAQFATQFGHYVDRFVPFAGYPGIEGMPQHADRTAAFLDEQRSHSYDIAIQLHGDEDAANALITDLGAWVSAGYFRGEAPAALTIAARYPTEHGDIERMLDLVRLLGSPDCGTQLEFPLFFEDRREAKHLLDQLPSSGPLVGLHPGSRDETKRAPVRHFAELAEELVHRFGAEIVLLGTDADRDAIRAVHDCMEMEAKDLSGRTSLGGLAAAIRRLDLFIGNDSGPACVAHAVGTPSITVRPSPAGMDRGEGVDGAEPIDVCGRPGCANHRLTTDIRPASALPIAEQLLSAASAGDHPPASPVLARQPGPVGWARF